jgi:hypothetical protein
VTTDRQIESFLGEPTMTYRGHVKDGQITLDEPARLPEGAQVTIEVVEQNVPPGPQRRMRPRKFQPIEMPGGSLADELIRDRP